MPPRGNRIQSLLLLCGSLLLSVTAGGCVSVGPSSGKTEVGMEKVLQLPPGPGNPGNRRTHFFEMNDGRILLVYSRFYGDYEAANDHSTSYIAGRFSQDGGSNWSQNEFIVLKNEASMNTAATSMIRLSNGRVALFYSRKDSLSDCRPLMRVSSDEGKSWGEPVTCITDEVGYYVVNNDRVVRLQNGRLVIPVALHKGPDGKFVQRGTAMCYLSDDEGANWRRSRTVLEQHLLPKSAAGLQEPGVVELKDGRLMMFCRGEGGCQYLSYSGDGGETWSSVEASEIKSPLSPATIKRIPRTGDLLLVWNDHSDVAPEWRTKRTPLSVALSRDDGKTWENRKPIEQDPQGWYCYTSMFFTGNHVLLGYSAGTRPGPGLNLTQITRINIDWLYQ